MSIYLKYTDRDVRSQEFLTDLAYEYLDSYEGEFEFLIDCKMRVASDRQLTIGMIRGVLNCMRIDPRLPYDLPEPLPEDEVHEANVIPMRSNKKKKSRKKNKLYPCPLMERGVFHSHKTWVRDMEHCSGLYRINRQVVKTDATFNGELLAKGKSYTSVLIHKVDHGFFVWYPKWTHEYGFGHVELRVKLACKIPSWLTDPTLMRPEHVGEYNKDPWELKGNPLIWTYCSRCFPQE